MWNNLFVFDSVQLGFVAGTTSNSGGYLAEQNHAFFPMFPWMTHSIAAVLGDDSFVWTGLCLGLAQSYLNMLLLYRLALLLYKDRKVAELSAYLYVASFSALYQITLYSENTFLLFTQLGLLVIYAGRSIKQANQAAVKPQTVKSSVGHHLKQSQF